VLLGLTLSASLVGCAASTPGSLPAAPAGPPLPSPQLADLSRELQSVRSQIDATSAALAALTNTGADELPTKFQAFTASFDQAVADAKRVQALASGFRADGRETLRRWADEKAGAAALDEAREAFGDRYVASQSAVTASLDALRESLTPHMQALYDTIGYLQVELTPQRVADIRPMAEESALTAEVVKARIDVVLAELRALDVLPPPR
jgi:hypothetical protein